MRKNGRFWRGDLFLKHWESRAGYEIGYIQNRTNWCWAVACKMTGGQFGRNTGYFTGNRIYNVLGPALGKAVQPVVRTREAEGIRKEIVPEERRTYVVDAWQRAIVMNANTICPGSEGNIPGNDEAKIRGLKYVLTGDCYSSAVKIRTIGSFDMRESLQDFCEERMQSVFGSHNFMIGNAILHPKGVSHSFVLLGVRDHSVMLYDPWDGSIRTYSASAVFRDGFASAMGTGIIKWIQYIGKC